MVSIVQVGTSSSSTPLQQAGTSSTRSGEKHKTQVLPISSHHNLNLNICNLDLQHLIFTKILKVIHIFQGFKKIAEEIFLFSLEVPAS